MKRNRWSWTLLAGVALPSLLSLLSLNCATHSANEPPAPEHSAELQYPRWETHDPGEYADQNRRQNLVQRGREVYDKYCVGCHGDYGQGDGPAAPRLITKPRDFTSGVYKFRSTDSGSLPMEADLYRTITRGLSGVSMPAFPLMPHRDKLAVIEYIKQMYPRWEDERNARVLVPVPRAPTDLGDPMRVARGQVVYVAMQCTQCHGVDGAGTGATRTEYVDAWGEPQRPHNFNRGSLKGGDSPEDIYRTFHTGLRSIMPSYGGTTLGTVMAEGFPPGEGLLEPGELEQLAPALAAFPQTANEMAQLDSRQIEALTVRNSWDLVAYILSLRQDTTTADAVLGSSGGGTLE